MKINQAEELAGISRKNIRFYEEQGLIRPGRDPENGYRDYTLADVEQLKRIRLLRKLDIPCEKIRGLFSGELPMKQCMDEQISALQQRIQASEHMQEICASLSEEAGAPDKLDPELYLERMQRLEEGGVSFVDVTKTDISRRRNGAIIAAAVMIVFFAGLIALFIWANLTAPIPPLIFGLIIAVPAAVILGIVIALLQRIKELKGGEYDDARKY